MPGPANSLNISQTGLVKFDGTATFTGVTLTQHDLLIGAASNGITSVTPSSTSGVPVISQGAASDPTFGTAVVAGGGTGTTSFNINGAVYSNTSGTGILNAATLTSGQLLIGGTTTPAAGTITAGTGITVTNGNNSITISGTGGSFAWTDATSATQTLVAQNGYVTDRGGGVTYTLPASGTLGDMIKIVGKLGTAVITPNANQQIIVGSTVGKVGVTGTATSNNAGDCMELICITAGASSTWTADSVVGTWTVVTS